MSSHRSEILDRLEREDMHDALLTVAEAAIYADATEQQIRDWKRRGHLHPAGYGIRRRPMFRAIDVLRARGAAERNLERTQAQNLASTCASATA